MPSWAPCKYFTTIVLPGGCEFLVYPPSSLRLPYYPANPRIEHSLTCQCMDEDKYMDDDGVFMSIWLSFWALWNGKRVLAPELRNERDCREKARNMFSLPEVRASIRAWDLPLIGGGRFKPSPRTMRPIEWFWNSLEGARDLAHCEQPAHATRFQIRFDLPRGPGWKEQAPRNPSRRCPGDRMDESTAEEPGSNRLQLNSTTTKRESMAETPGNKGNPTNSSSESREIRAMNQMEDQIDIFSADIVRLLGLNQNEKKLNKPT